MITKKMVFTFGIIIIILITLASMAGSILGRLL